MKILIVDDEPLARSRLRAQVAELAAGEVVGEAVDGADALMKIAALAPDVLLLDIRMPGMDGLELVRHLSALPSKPAVIFTTAHEEHALAAFEASAIDYLLKPVRASRLHEALQRAALFNAARWQALAAAGETAARTHLSALSKGALRLVPVREVRYFQADQGYVTVRYPEGELLTEDSLRALEQEFGALFLRIHRNTLVALAWVTALERDARGNPFVRVRDVPDSLPVSRRLLGEVRRRLRHLVLP
jgi:two-component system response regulator AlgR